MTIFVLPREPVFPDPALAEANGLLAVGGDLSAPRLLKAYRLGIFPWYSENSPILWWSPQPRLIVEPGRIHVPSRLERILRQGAFHFTLDHAFAEVITACARTPRPKAMGTWIVPEMIAAYVHLHQLGFAHSIEAWQGERLVGGLYGVALGRVFFGESMFYHSSNASKAAFVTLARALCATDYSCIDCQQTTAHMLRFGGFEVTRRNFLFRLTRALSRPTQRGRWSLHQGRIDCRALDACLTSRDYD